MDREEYNNEPVFYCKDCLSLRVKTVTEGLDLDFCDDCGSTNIATAHIEEWRALYRDRYGFDYLTNELIDNGRDKQQTYL